MNAGVLLNKCRHLLSKKRFAIKPPHAQKKEHFGYTKISAKAAKIWQ